MVGKILMPKATAVWLIDNTALTFEQIADFCGMHTLEVQALADRAAHRPRASRRLQRYRKKSYLSLLRHKSLVSMRFYRKAPALVTDTPRCKRRSIYTTHARKYAFL